MLPVHQLGHSDRGAGREGADRSVSVCGFEFPHDYGRRWLSVSKLLALGGHHNYGNDMV